MWRPFNTDSCILVQIRACECLKPIFVGKTLLRDEDLAELLAISSPEELFEYFHISKQTMIL